MYFTTGAQLQAALNALPASKKGGYVAFDAFYYGNTYMTGYQGTLSPIEHFVQIGAARGYAPNDSFDPVYYADAYADLRGKGFDAADLLYHFMQYGLDEGRAPNATLAQFDGLAYLAANPDVALYVNAHLDQFGGSATNGAIAHYVKFGQFEGRAAVYAGTDSGQSFTLTTEQDGVVGTAGSDTISGNSATFNPGDVIEGAAGADRLTLVLNESTTAYAGAVVSGIEQIDLRSIASTAVGADAVVLSMTDVAGLETLNIIKSTGNTVIEDLQGGVAVGINDVRGDVTIDFDNQNVPASVDVSVNEFGAAAGAVVQSVLTMDAGVDTVNISDDATDASYDNNFGIVGGFSALNVTGGANGTSLTMDIESSAAELVADFTGNESDAKDIGVDVGEDQLLQLTTGQYDDTVDIRGLLVGASTVDVGAGNDEVTTDDIAGDVLLGEGDNALTGGAVSGSVTAGAGVDSVALTGELSGEVSVGAGADEVSVAGAVTGLVDLGADADSLSVTGTVSGSVVAGAGDDEVEVTGNVLEGGTIDAGAGADAVSLAELEGTLLGGDGDDTLAVAGDVETTGVLNAGAGNDAVTVGWELEGAAAVDLGAGDDTLTIGADPSADDEVIDETSSLAGGDGNDTLVIARIRPNDYYIDGVSNNDGTDPADSGENRITGIENLVIRVLDTADGESDVVEGTVDLSAFDSALTSITVDVQGPEWGSSAGDASDHDFTNWTTETFTVTSVESSSLQEAELDAEDLDYDVNRTDAVDDSSIESLTTGGDDFETIQDVTISVGAEDGTGLDDTVSVTLNGTQAFDVGIYDSTAVEAIENLSINLADDLSHTIDLGNDFAGTLTVTGGAAATSINLLNVDSATIAAAIAANVYADLDSDQDHDITTGAGADVVNAIDDTVDFDDAIDLGAGRDRLIVRQDMGDIATEDDSLFETKFNIEELQVSGLNNGFDGEGDLYDVNLDDDAFATGIDTLILSQNSEVTVQMGNDFERGLTVNVEDMSDLFLTNDTTDGTGQYDLTLNVDKTGVADEDNEIALTDSGVDNTVALNVTVGDDTLLMAVAAAAAEDNIALTNLAGDGVDTITFIDSAVVGADNGEITVELDDSWQADATLTINAGAIADNDSVVDDPETPASEAIDGTATGGITITNVADVTYALNVTGTANDDDVTATDQADTLNLGAGDDTVDGGDGVDTINGQGGNDVIEGGLGADTITGGDGDDTIFGSIDEGALADTLDGGDAINAGAGNDTIFGGAGNDAITTGAGSDLVVFSYSSTFAVTGELDDNVVFNGRDTVADFTAGADGDVLAFGSTAGPDMPAFEGGTFGVLESIDLAGAGRLTLEDELAVVQTISVTAEDNAAVAGWFTDASTGGVVVTGNAGASQLYVWYVNSLVDGDDLQITADDVSLVGVVNLAAGQSIADLTAANFFGIPV